MNDIDRIINYMKEHGSITCKECEKDIGTTELRRRICDIKGMGYEIGDVWETGENRVGNPTRFKRYFILKEPNSAEKPKEPQKEQQKKHSLWDRLKKIKDLTYIHKNGSMDIIGMEKPKPQKIDITVKIEGE